ncbi:MAG: response regulator [Proteobacteria bacterium]|nr:response regulator [Pseudomonadota bacterium]
MKILVIEDNPSNMKLAVRLLEGEGYDVLQAVEAESGLELAVARRPELILLDMQLPGMDGLSALKRLKEDELTRDMKVIALTAFAMDGDRERFLKAGCDGYMAKPINYKEFLKMIESYKSGSDNGE